MHTLFSYRFATSQEAVDACQNLAHQEGFSVRIRTSKASTVYIVCSKEGRPEFKLDSKKRSRNSERCFCGWRIVLMFNTESKYQLKWEFRPGKTMFHNHTLELDRLCYIPFLKTPSNSYPIPEFEPLIAKSGLNINLPSIRTLFHDLYPPPLLENTSPTPNSLSPHC